MEVGGGNFGVVLRGIKFSVRKTLQQQERAQRLESRSVRFQIKMNLNPGRGSFDLGHEQQSSPIRTRGYVDQNMAPSSSPPSIPVANNRPFPHGEGDNNIQTELDPTDEGSKAEDSTC
jgi:hypothetical protein